MGHCLSSFIQTERTLNDRIPTTLSNGKYRLRHLLAALIWKDVPAALALARGKGLSCYELLEQKPENIPKYTVGKLYKLQVDALSVRVSPGTAQRRKPYAELTENAKAHAYPTGHLKKGTAVTCLETKTLGKDVWMRIPSGWCAAYYGGEMYIG